MKSLFNTSELSSSLVNYKFDMLKLFNKLTVRMEPDMDTYSCSIAIDMIEAYYKVSFQHQMLLTPHPSTGHPPITNP